MAQSETTDCVITTGEDEYLWKFCSTGGMPNANALIKVLLRIQLTQREKRAMNVDYDFAHRVFRVKARTAQRLPDIDSFDDYRKSLYDGLSHSLSTLLNRPDAFVISVEPLRAE